MTEIIRTPTLEEAIEALREAAQRSYNYFEPDNQPEYYNRWKAIVERYDYPQGNGIAAALGDAASIRAATIEECAKVAESAAAWRAETGSRVDVAARIRSLSNGKV